MAGISARLRVVEAIKTALEVPSFRALATGGIHSDVPQAPTYPLVWLTVRETPMNTFSKQGAEVGLTVHVYSTYGGVAEAEGILDAAVALLRFELPPVAGHTTLLLVYQGSFDRPDELIGGVKVKHHEARYTVLVEVT